MGFVLFSKYAQDPGNVLTLLTAGSCAGTNKRLVPSGRIDSRQSEKTNRDKAQSLKACRSGHSVVPDDSPFKRGINLEHRQQLAMLEQNEKKLVQRESENEVFVLSQLITNQLATNEQRFRIATRFGQNTKGHNDPSSPYWVSYFNGVEEVEVMQNKLRAINERNLLAARQEATKRSLTVGLLGFVENKKTRHGTIANNKKLAPDYGSTTHTKSVEATSVAATKHTETVAVSNNNIVDEPISSSDESSPLQPIQL